MSASGDRRQRPVRGTAAILPALALATATVAMKAIPAPVPDFEREARIANQIRDAILDGEPVTLQAGDGQRFLAIDTGAATQPAAGTAVILHGRGHHPDWTDAIQPLRVGLAESDWNTLSIQLPVLHGSASYYDYVAIFDAAIPRIEAAIAAARQRHGGRVVLIAHSCGAHMAQHWLLQRRGAADAQIDAFVGIGMGATDLGQPMRVPFALDQVSGPVLDVYAANDFPAVRRLADERRRMMQDAGHPKSAQVVVEDAGHYFVGRGDELLGVVRDWLQSL
jgi:hypothetical protein